MLYTRQIRNKVYIRVKQAPDIDFSFVRPESELEFRWWKGCLSCWLEGTPARVLVAMSTNPEIKGKLVDALTDQYRKIDSLKVLERMLTAEDLHRSLMVSDASYAIGERLHQTRNSPFAAIAADIDRMLSKSLEPYILFEGNSKLDVTI